MSDEALLGLATTGELLVELEARFAVSGDRELEHAVMHLRERVPTDLLEYRTVDG